MMISTLVSEVGMGWEEGMTEEGVHIGKRKEQIISSHFLIVEFDHP